MDEEDIPQEDAPLEEDERDLLRQDLVDIRALREMLGSKGLKGAVFFCPDCEEDHYLTWDLLEGNLEQLLQRGESPVHEPAFDPDPEEYVSWDYARGFLDGYESFEEEDFSNLAVQLVFELQDRGWRPDQVKALFARVGLQVPVLDISESSDGD
ncbi:MAG: DUF5319 domain-containing protein [Actinomycetota bacterium]|nr:DUF5319 domain-containing protein [Actinomycetota bacterium]